MTHSNSGKTSQGTGVTVTNNLMEGNFPKRASWSRGHFNSWQTATAAYYIWAANHSKNEQKHSRSGRMKRSLSLFRRVFLPETEPFSISTGEWQNSGRRRQKKIGGETYVILLSLLIWVKHSLSHSSVQQKLWQRLQTSYFRKICSTLSLMRRPFSVHWMQKMELHHLAC